MGVCVCVSKRALLFTPHHAGDLWMFIAQNGTPSGVHMLISQLAIWICWACYADIMRIYNQGNMKK